MRASSGLATFLGCLAVPAAIVLASGCGAESPSWEQTATRSESITIVDNPTCKVEWTKIDYDQPGTDSSEFIELFVTKTGALVNTLGDCGIGAITLFDSGNCLAPYRIIPLQSVSIPADGYVVICNGTVGCDVNVAASPWLDDGPAEIGFLSATLPSAPILWASYEGPPQCVPLATNPPKIDVKTENNTAPNLINVWCASGFALVPATSSPKRQPNVCPAVDGGSGGASGSGGSSAAGGSGGSSAAGGSGGSSATGGSGGSAANGGAGGSAASGGSAGSAASGGSAGSAASGGSAGSSASGGAAGSGGSGGSAGSAASGGDGGSAASGGNSGSTASGGFGGSAASAGSGGSSAADGGSAATAGSLGLGDPNYEIQGGGSCACSVPDHRSGKTAWLIAGAIALGLLRRRSGSAARR